MILRLLPSYKPGRRPEPGAALLPSSNQTTNMRVAAALLVLVGGLLMPPTQAGTVEVIHDDWGVPHIFASDRAAASYGYGWASRRRDCHSAAPPLSLCRRFE